MTNHEAKLYLAEQLPERIYVLQHDFAPNGVLFIWKQPGLAQILETEWQQIALWVEEKMTQVNPTFQIANYQLCLRNVTGEGCADCDAPTLEEVKQLRKELNEYKKNTCC